jgi:drug/metabolite transporter (DMT)-like permease
LIPPSLLGQLAGLATSFFFTFTSVFFTLASRQVGAVVLNRIRLVLALSLLALSHWVIYGSPMPNAASSSNWLWLGLSGLVGLALGDIFLFQGFAWIGPRLTMLMMSLSPILTALLAWLFLKEDLALGQVIGILLAVSGIVWVVLERNGASAGGVNLPTPNLGRGLAAGLAAAACQSLGLILARPGLANGFPALSGNFIRMSSAAVVIWLLTLVQGQTLTTFRTLHSHPTALRLAAIGAFTGPFLGVSLSLFAIQNTEVGVASTLMALPPVLLLPVGYFFFHERFGWQAVAGTLLALTGSAVLFLV